MTRKINAVEHGSPPPKLFHSVVEISTRLVGADQVAACRGGEIAIEVSAEAVRLKPAGCVVTSTRCADFRQKKLTALSEKHRASHFRDLCVSNFCSVECDACTPRYTHTRLIRSEFLEFPRQFSLAVWDLGRRLCVGGHFSEVTRS